MHILLLYVLILITEFGLALENKNTSQPVPPQASQIEKLISCLKLEGGPESTASLVEHNINSTEYQTLNYQWNTNTRLGVIQPLANILPKNSKEVQIAIKCGRKLNIKMVAKSGGHSYEKYSFGGPRTVVIDLQKLTAVTIDPKTKTVAVGTGMLMGPLYWELWNSTNGKFGIPGTSCPTAGIGGVTLGGGLGFWSKRYGLVSDNVLEFEFVDPQGEILIVNKKTNPDLFWALRGSGGGNFGIVTKFKIRLLDVSNFRVTNIELNYDPNMFKKVFKSWQAYNYKIKDKPTFAKLTISPERIRVRIVDLNLTPKEVTAIRKNFPKLKTGNTHAVTWMNFIDFVILTANIKFSTPTDLKNVVRKDNPQHSYRAKSYYASKLLTDNQIKILKPILSKIPKGNFVTIDSYGGEINKVPSDATAFVHRNSLYCVQVGIRTAANDRIAELWVRTLDAEVMKTLDNGESYQNYVDAELPYPIYLKRYYGRNLARLVEIKNKIDQDNYFVFEQSIPLTLPSNITRF